MKENDRTLSIKDLYQKKKKKERKKKELKSFDQQRNNLAFARYTAAVAPSLQFPQCCPISACQKFIQHWGMATRVQAPDTHIGRLYVYRYQMYTDR